MLRQWWASILMLAIAVVLAVIGTTPPEPRPLNTPEAEFSSARAMEDIRIIAEKPHPTGSIANAEVRAYLAKRLGELGAEVSFEETQLGERALNRLNRWSGESKTEQSIVNVIGVLAGRVRSKPAVLLMAHHDTVWGSPGAADDTIGIASIFEIVRALKTEGQQERDLILLFTDGEEVGLVGAKHFFNTNPLSERVGAVINFEARGGGGTANMFQTSAQNGALATLYARAVKQPSASSLSTFIYNALPNDTDLTPALEKDYAAFNIANIGRAEYYHSPKITPEALSDATVQHMGSQGLDLTRALLSANALPPKTSDATFFDVFGLFTIIYPPMLGWLFLVLAAIFYGLSLKGASHGDKSTFKDIVTGSFKMTGFLIGGGVLLYVLNRLSGSALSPDYYDRLAAIPRLEVMGLFAVIALFFSFFGRKDVSASRQFGAAVPLFLLGIVGQALAPTATYFISLSLLLCGLCAYLNRLLVGHIAERSVMSFPIVGLAAVTLGYSLTLGHLLMLGVGPDVPSIAIIPAAIAALACLTVYCSLSRRSRYYAMGAALFPAVVISLWIRLDPIASTVPLY